MTEPESAKTNAWQPFTVGGIQAFAAAGFNRTIGVLLAFAFVNALLVFIAFDLGWRPLLDEAVQALPKEGEIRRGQLRWAAETPKVLAESRLLQIAVDIEASRAFGHEADLRLEFRQRDVLVNGLFGNWVTLYPQAWIVSANRDELVPLWGAWRPFVRWGFGGATFVALLGSWMSMAFFAGILMRLFAFYGDRKATLGGCWRMALMAFQPGGLLMGAATCLYGLQRLNMIELLVCFVGHFLVSLIYLIVTAARLPRLTGPASVKVNPFAGTA